MINYGFTKHLDLSFSETVDFVVDELKNEGFGVITTIDLQQKFKEKLGINHPKYIIIGACNPASAYQAISVEDHIGLLLPCNVIIFEKEDHTVLSIIRPTIATGMIKNDELNTIAASTEKKLKKVFDTIQD